MSNEDVVALGEAIAETAALIDAATHRFLTQLREFDAADGWARAETLTCAHWLSWRVGMNLGAAREKVRVARKLAELPLIDGALAAGEVSYSKVRAMTRVATADNEADLLNMARNTTAAQLERICRLTRQVQSPSAEEARAADDERRYVMSRATDDGMVSIHLRLHPDEAARVMKALEVCAEGGRLVDGAVAMADSALAGGPSGEGDPPGSGRPPVEAIVHISADALAGHTDLGDGLSAEISRRLLCDAGVVPVLEDGAGRIIDVGRKTRTIPPALRRALRARDRGCRFPGCTHTRFVDAHHVEHWLDGGETNLGNTLLLCRHHHRAIHEHGFTVGREGEAVVFRNPAGAILAPSGPRPALRADAFDLLRRRVDPAGALTPATNAPGWDGWPVDYDLCVSACLAPPESRTVRPLPAASTWEQASERGRRRGGERGGVPECSGREADGRQRRSKRTRAAAKRPRK